MKKYVYKELKEKSERYKNIKLEDITLDDIDANKEIKIDRRKMMLNILMNY